MEVGLTELTKEQKDLFRQWMIDNFRGAHDIVPADEGLDEGLLYNLLHWLNGDEERYAYRPDQIEEMQSILPD